jgi:molybdenum cofactor synthesis domain-containing protein
MQAVSSPRAVYLAIGTELTSGQITNRNASWISSRLEEAGIATSWHFCVPDDRALMREAMELASQRGDLIFITGGLGPTSDDFTRDVVAEWWGESLEWYEPSWTKAVARLALRGIHPPESSKQQAWYPRGSRVLTNREGTADAFLLEKSGKAVFVLPGPPREIEAVWQDHIASWISEKFGNLRPIEPLRWTLLGRSEAQLADGVEEAVKGSGLLTGYRATPPYVEVKIWIPEGLDPQAASVREALERLERTLAPWVVARGDEDVLDRFFESESAGPLRLVDRCTPGLLSDRVWKWARAKPQRLEKLRSLELSVQTLCNSGTLDEEEGSKPGWTLELGPLVQEAHGVAQAQCRVSTRSPTGEKTSEEMGIPFP